MNSQFKGSFPPLVFSICVLCSHHNTYHSYFFMCYLGLFLLFLSFLLEYSLEPGLASFNIVTLSPPA